MYLSKLRMVGFKSFANRVEVNFPAEGVTSVVGPNGCGKSNIIDAIRWVLGEQRPRALRSSKMEDVIFSGTAERPALGMAEVSLIVNNDNGVLLSDYAQVMITRRAYRDGDSEYLINNQPCRLKDIHNLFYDTGMGAASYSLIEAKMIDSILSDKAEERRVMFEEAAGISKYKQQRKETLRQLEHTAQDLTRVEDNLRHVQQNVNLFERQAKKAEKWRELKAAYRSLELSVQHDAYRGLAAKLEPLAVEQAKDENHATELDARRSVEEASIEAEKLGLFEEERELSELGKKTADAQAEAIRLESEAERNRDRIGHLDESLRRLRLEAAEAKNRLQELDKQKKETLSESEEAERILTGAAEKAASGRAGLDEAMARWQEVRSETDALGEKRMAALEHSSLLKQQLGTAEAEVTLLGRNEEEGIGERGARAARLHEKQAERELASTDLVRAVAEAAEAAAGAEKARKTAEAAGAASEQARIRWEDKRREQVAAETRQRILAGLEAEGEGMDAGVRHLLGTSKDKLRSLLGDALKVPAEILVPVEKALGKSLQMVLVEDRNRGMELLSILRQTNKGEAVFGTPGKEFHRPRPDLSGRHGFLGWFVDRIQSPPEWRGILEWALGHHALVADLESAFALTEELRDRDVWLWTPEGSAWHTGGLLYGGSPAAESGGLLQRKAQLDDARSRLAGIESELAAAETGMREADARKAELLEEMERWRQRAGEAEQRGHAARTRLQMAESQAQTLQGEWEQWGVKLGSLAERRAELRRSAEVLRGAWETAEAGRQALEGRYQSALEKAQERETERRGREEAWRALEREKSEAEARMRALRARFEYLQSREAELREMLERAAVQEEDWKSQAKLLQERTGSLSGEIQAAHARLAGEEKGRDAAKSVYDAKAGGLEERRAGLRRLQDALRDLTQRAHERALRLEQARAAMQSIRERMFEIHEVDFAAEEPAFERVEYNSDTAADEIAELKEKLKSVGNINTGAVEEYEAEKARLEETRGQFDDLAKARLGLERAIKRLDKAAREQFIATFAVVQKNFQDVFSSLFEGGEAQLALEEGVDSLDAKIEINARPTGKKMRGVGLLSGGERALTAISLLFALYLVRPSPYCIMDEVDGPLDDANIGRFVNLLRRFSHQTQFIVVTHNKRTMAASDMLYGVTQEIKGISKLVSVQLDEAARIAA